jgi:hypothetical protein
MRIASQSLRLARKRWRSMGVVTVSEVPRKVLDPSAPSTRDAITAMDEL